MRKYTSPECKTCSYRQAVLGRDHNVDNPYPFNFMKMLGNQGEQQNTFGKKVTEYREEKGLSREKLAKIVEKYSLQYGTRFTAADLRGYEMYNVSPKIDKLYALCKATGKSLSYFTGYPDEWIGSGDGNSAMVA